MPAINGGGCNKTAFGCLWSPRREAEPFLSRASTFHVNIANCHVPPALPLKSRPEKYTILNLASTHLSSPLSPLLEWCPFLQLGGKAAQPRASPRSLPFSPACSSLSFVSSPPSRPRRRRRRTISAQSSVSILEQLTLVLREYLRACLCSTDHQCATRRQS
jgi:hypothetical protein